MEGVDEFLNFMEYVFGTEDVPAGAGDDVKVVQKGCECLEFDASALKSPYEAIRNGKNMRKIAYKMEVAERADMYRIRPSEVSRILTHIDLRLYRNVHPLELVMYDGSADSDRKCKTLSSIMAKNSALTSLVCGEMGAHSNFRYFYRLAAELLRTKNYNSFECVVSGIRAVALTKRQLVKLTALVGNSGRHEETRRNIHEGLSRHQLFVPALQTILKDIQESNLNTDNEMASMRFCKVVELFVYVQNLDPRFKVRSKHEHLIIHKMSQSKTKEIRTYEVISEKQYAHFLLWDVPRHFT